MNEMRFSNLLRKCLPFIYISFFVSVFIGFRVMSSTCEGVLLGFTILFALLDKHRFKISRERNYFVYGCIIYYLLQFTSLLYTDDWSAGMQQIQVKLSLLFIPVILYYNNYLNKSFGDKIMPYYVLLLALTMMYGFGIALRKYSSSHDGSVFFYHSLVEPFGHHAIQFSIYAFIGLIYLLERSRNRSFIINRSFHIFAIFFYIFFIILLASKMVIIFSLVSIVFYINISIKDSKYLKKRLMFSVITGSCVVFAIMMTHNPISDRFKDIFKGDINVVRKNQFNPGDYFNGLQFRLLEWKLVAEILNEHNAWVLGIGPGDAQDLLNKKYLSLNMFVGNDKSNSRGFLGYNTHNEFLESILQTGIIGLFAFLFIYAGCVQMMVSSRSIEMWFIGSLLLSYCFLESVLQTQYGVLLFTFFPLFFYYTTGKQSKKGTANSLS